MFNKLNIKKLDDEKLVHLFQEQEDVSYLEELFGRYIRFVYIICMKYLKDDELSKDMSMQIFEKLMTDLKRFEVNNFKSWLHVVTKNMCLMHLRSNKEFVNISDNFKKEADDDMEFDDQLHHINNKELELEQLEKAISILDDEQKRCIELFYLQEKSYKDVADITGFTLNQVKSHIQNGKRNMKNYILSNRGIMSVILFVLYFKI